MNKRVIESLIKAGALDSLGKRGQLYGRGRQGHGARAEGAEGCRAGPDRPVRTVQRRAGARRGTATICPTCRTGKRASAWRTKKKCSGSLSPVTRWTSMPRRSQSDRRDFDRRSAGAQAAGAALGQGVRPGRRDPGCGNDAWAAGAEDASAKASSTRRQRSKTRPAKST